LHEAHSPHVTTLSPLSCSEAPVRIISSNEETPHTYMAGQRVELWCQLSRAEAPVRWYKDGEEVEEGESLVLEREGLRCRLVLPCAHPQDTGEFVCDVGGDSAFYTITVAGESQGLRGVRGTGHCESLQEWWLLPGKHDPSA